jgi:PAS domain S-box-containing protein
MAEIEDIAGDLELMIVSRDERNIERFKQRSEQFETDLEIDVVDSIPSAMESLSRKRYDCILTDHVENGIDGLKVLEEVRENFSKIPVILVTREGSESLASKAIEKGVADYIDKEEASFPVVFKRLFAAIERKRKEESLRKYKAAADTLNEALYLADPEGNLLWASESWDYAGYSPEEVIGKDAFELLDIEGTTPEINQEIQKKLARGEVATLEMQITNKYGERRDIELRFKNFELESGEIGRIGIGRDITELKDRERKLKEVSSLVKHDIREPLEIARGHLELAKEMGEKEDLEAVENALENISMIIKNLEVIAEEPDDVETAECSLEQHFVEAIELIKQDPDYEVEDRKLDCNKPYLVRLASNLIQNSVKHNSEDVKVCAGPTEEGFFYADNGKGISDSIKDDITEKGFTTSDSSRGLGMYIVQRIVDLHGWDMEVKDSESGGARFEFTV